MTTQSESVRFVITRTSGGISEDAPPCPEAIEGVTPYWDIRTIESAEAFDAKFGPRETWHARGSEHQAHRGPNGERWIKRRLEDHKAWFVEFTTLADLLAFHKKYGSLIIEDAFGSPGQPAVEIYDDYRE